MNWIQISKRFLSQAALAGLLINLFSVSAFAASSGLIISAGADRSINFGEALAIDAIDILDSNAVYAQNLAGETYSGTLNWGDGSTEDISSAMHLTETALFFQGTHLYGAAGLYTVEACLDDDETGYICDSFTVEVMAIESALPDLIVESQFNSDDMSFDFTVSNIGLGDLPLDAFPYLGFHFDFFNADFSTSIDTNYLIDDYGSDYRTAGGSTTFNTGPAEDLPSCTVYYLLVVDEITDADDEDEIPAAEAVVESDESNNENVGSFEICEEIDPVFTVEAENGEAVGIGTIFVIDTEAYAYNFASEPLVSATINWGDGTPVETAVQFVSGDRIYLQGSRSFMIPDEYIVEICADDGVEDDCDQFSLFVVGNTSDNVSTNNNPSSPSSSSSSSDADVELSTEEDVVIDESLGEGLDEPIDEALDEDVELATEEDAEEECNPMAFEDIATDANYYDSLESLWCAGVIQGRNETVFAPEDEMLRSEAAKVFTRLFGYVTVPYGETPVLEESPFVDVNPSEPLAYYVSVATEEGIMDYESSEGGEAYFNPHNAVTVNEIIDALSLITGADASAVVNDAGYQAGETISRGNFVELVYSFVE